MEYLSAYPSTPTPAMILTPPARALSPSPPPEPIASTSRRVIDHILLPRLPSGWLSETPANGRDGGPVLDDKACHQCRNSKNPHPRYRCGRSGCVRTYCTSCLSRRYAWTPQDIHSAGCPGCRGVCNCSLCLDRAGLGAHKAFLTAAARSGGCARAWLAARGLLVEGAAAPPAEVGTGKKKNMARRPRIMSKKKEEEMEVGHWKAKKLKQADEEQDVVGVEERRGRWTIDASVAACAKFARRWARERAARGAQVRAGARRWFVGASPPPRAHKRRDTAVETIDLTLEDDDDEDVLALLCARLLATGAASCACTVLLRPPARAGDCVRCSETPERVVGYGYCIPYRAPRSHLHSQSDGAFGRSGAWIRSASIVMTNLTAGGSEDL